MFFFSPLPPLSCIPQPLLSAQHHPFVNPHHYPVMTLPFQFTPALSLPWPWPSLWNSRKRATSPPLLPSRSVSLRQHADTLPAHPQPLCFSLDASNNLRGEIRPPKRPSPRCVAQVFQEMWESSGKAARRIIQEKDLGLVNDTAQLGGICQKVVDSHPDEVKSAHTLCTSLLALHCFRHSFEAFCVFKMFRRLFLCR